METLIGLRSQGGVPVTWGSGLKKNAEASGFSHGSFAISFFDLFKVSKIFFDFFKVSKMTILVVTCSKLAKRLFLIMTCSKSVIVVKNRVTQETF